MLEKARQERQARIEGEIGLLSYERFRLSREIAERQQRIAEIDRLLAEHEGALRENERERVDIATQAAIDQAVTENTAIKKDKPQNGGGT